uniref:Snakin-2 n=1 Tax=Anthurium amnicola TaxID=1678845 RepID=A0A1D1ZGU7_9ARAE
MALRELVLTGSVLFFLIAVVEISTYNLPVVGDQEDGLSGGGRRLVQEGKIDCGGKCAVRCSEHSRPNLCARACGTCCARCNCVPPGTSGNRELCGTCYANMTTHGNRTKCP